jgi:hypothetical protein
MSFDREPVLVVEPAEQAGKQIGVGGDVHATFPWSTIRAGKDISRKTSCSTITERARYD